MAGNLNMISKKLIRALNTVKGHRLLLANKPFYGREGQSHNYYCIIESEYNPNTHKYDQTQLYGSVSMVRITLYLRDMWYIENDMELPTDQEIWNKVREGLIAKGQLKLKER